MSLDLSWSSFNKLTPLMLATFAGLIFSGCTITNLQRVEVESAPVQQAVRIADPSPDGELYARGFLSFNQDNRLQTQVRQHTEVNARGVFEVEESSRGGYIERAGVNTFPFRGDNFVWDLPEWEGGVELEFPFSESMVLSGGVGMAELDNSYQMNQTLAVGFLQESRNWASRVDFGVAFQQSRFNVEAVRGRDLGYSGDADRRIEILSFEDRGRYANPSVGFTLNSKNRGPALNYFFNYTLGRQTFYDVKDQFLFESGNEQFDFKYTESYNALSAGLYSNIVENGRVLFGFRWMKYADDRDQLALFKLFVQYDIRLQ